MVGLRDWGHAGEGAVLVRRGSASDRAAPPPVLRYSGTRGTLGLGPPPAGALPLSPETATDPFLGEEVAKAVGGGYCRLQMPLRPALAVRGSGWA